MIPRPRARVRSRRTPRPRGWRGALTIALSALSALSLVPHALRGQDSAAVVVTIEGERSGAIRVTERLRVAADSADTSARAAFQYLARPCAVLGEVLLDDGVRAVPLVARPNGPWRALEDTSASPSGAHYGLVIRYTVQHSSDAVDVPLVLPTLPVPRAAEAREGNVQLIVRLADARGAVTFPRLERARDGAWSARFVALPSFVHVQLTDGSARCRETRAAGDDGGLSWRFWLLVAILVVWVPVYQWWALRQSGDEA